MARGDTDATNGRLNEAARHRGDGLTATYFSPEHLQFGDQDGEEAIDARDPGMTLGLRLSRTRKNLEWQYANPARSRRDESDRTLGVSLSSFLYSIYELVKEG